MLFKLSNLNSNPALTLSYLNPVLNNSARDSALGRIDPSTVSSTFDWHGLVSENASTPLKGNLKHGKIGKFEGGVC